MGLDVGDPRQSDEALIALAGILVAEQSLEKTLGQVLRLACGALPGANEGGITLLAREGPETAVATSEEARRVDELQYESGCGGPCLEAYRRQQNFRIDSTADDPRWPDFCQAAAAAGIGSTLSVPLIVNGDGLGAINLYCRHERGFSAADETAVVAFAAHAVVALANARIYWRAQRLASQLEEALATRGVIEQAKGILIAQYGCTADEAFGTLVSASQRGHQKLHDVARQLVEDTRQRR